MPDIEYFTCEELLIKYPLTKLWKWNPVKIGIFYNCLLLDGRRFGKNSRIMVTDGSFKKLMDFTIANISIVEPSQIYLSYEEVLENIPQAVYYRWTPTVIGNFYKGSLLIGKRSKAEQRNLVKETSVIRLINFTGQRFENIRKQH